MRRVGPLLLLALVALLFVGGRLARAQLGLELSPASVHAVVAGLGWAGPALFVGLVTFRQFLFLPSALVLPAGGVVFGAAFGTLLGALGIVLSAVLKYGVARALGREWLERRFGAAVAAFERHAGTVGTPLVALVTAHPAGPMSPIFWAAGFAAVPLLGFLVAVVVAAPVRAFAYAFFGATLLEPGSPRFWLATVLLVLAVLGPLAHPGLRGRILRSARRRAPTA